MTPEEEERLKRRQRRDSKRITRIEETILAFRVRLKRVPTKEDLREIERKSDAKLDERDKKILEHIDEKLDEHGRHSAALIKKEFRQRDEQDRKLRHRVAQWALAIIAIIFASMGGGNNQSLIMLIWKTLTGT